MNHIVDFTPNKCLAYINEHATGRKPTDKELKEQLGNARRLYYWLLERQHYVFYWYDIEKELLETLVISKPTMRNYRRKLQQYNYIYSPNENSCGWIFIPYPDATPGELPYFSKVYNINRFDNYYNPEYLQEIYSQEAGAYAPQGIDPFAYLRELYGYNFEDDIQLLTKIRDTAQRALDDAIARKPMEHSEYVKQIIKNFGRYPQEENSNGTGTRT